MKAACGRFNVISQDKLRKLFKGSRLCLIRKTIHEIQHSCVKPKLRDKTRRRYSSELTKFTRHLFIFQCNHKVEQSFEGQSRLFERPHNNPTFLRISVYLLPETFHGWGPFEQS